MSDSHDARNPPADAGLSRRELLRRGAVAAGALCLPRAMAQHSPRPSRGPARLADLPWWLDKPEDSRVVEVRSQRVARGSVIDQRILARMVETGLTAFTGQQTASDAWRTILGSARKIVLKFNDVGSEVIQTNTPVADALLTSLKRAEYDPALITLVETGSSTGREFGVKSPIGGWGAAISVGSEQEQLAAYLYNCDAVINVPVIKTHQIAGMSCCMKNLSHALIRRPAMYHGGGCAPAVGQIVGNKEISSRLCLNVVNALRIVIRNGPEAREADLVEFGGLLFGYDPAALDISALDALEQERRRVGETAAIIAPSLESAIEIGVGRTPTAVERLTADGAR
ncbi:MAG: DUF362 domain-containing protein [Phycisphaerae bacterium]